MLNRLVYTPAQAARRVGFHFNEAANLHIQEMHKAIHELGGIQFNIEIDKNGDWITESTNIKGIISGGNNPRDIPASLKDAIFTYFEIPPHLCNDTLIKADGEPVQMKRRVYA